MELYTGLCKRESQVIAAPNLLVDVLLEQDIYSCEKNHQTLAIVTRSMKREITNGVPQSTVASDAQDQPSSNGVELRGKEGKN